MKTTKRLSVTGFARLKSESKKIVMVTGYDYPSAKLLEEAGIDVILVGDSLATVVQGHDSTIPVTLDQMIYHAEMVVRATTTPMVLVDLPFPCCQLGPDEAIRAAARILKETGAGGVKIEGGHQRAETIKAVVDAGIPVIGHCGLLPPSVYQMGGYKIQRNIDQLSRDMEAVINAGVFGVVLECVCDSLVGPLVQKSPVPVIGIGSGNDCDGQVLVFHDFINYWGLPPTELPRHARSYAQVGSAIKEAAKAFADDVRSGIFPTEKESF